MPGPLPAIGVVLSFIAKKGAKEAVKKYGKQAVDAAAKYARRDKKPKPRRTLKQEKRAKENKMAAGLLGAQGAAATTVIGGNIYAGAKAGERRRRELAEKKRKQLFEKEKDKNKKPVKKAKGGMVTKWESKWG